MFHSYFSFRGKQKFIEVSGGKLAYMDIGKGPAILLLHGVPTSGWLYRKMIDPLVKQGFRVIIPDMLGFGSSDATEDQSEYAYAKQAERIVALMDMLEIQTWNHVCHDLGGIWTWELLNIASVRISKLIILNTILFEEGFNPPWIIKSIQPGNIFHKIFMSMYRFMPKMMIEGTLRQGVQAHKFSKEDLEGYTYPIVEEQKFAALEHFFTTMQTDIYPKLASYQSALKKFSGGVNVVWGKYDPILKVDQVQSLQNFLNLPDENIQIFENGKHYLAEELTTSLTKTISNMCNLCHL